MAQITITQLTFLAATLSGAVGLWLLLPRRERIGRRLGAILAIISLGLFSTQLAGLGHWLDDSVFAVLAAVTIASAVGTVTMRNPVYCAIWFGLTLLGTGGLLLFQGAQFLGVATVVVYAGAILVTFLFVLMLANPKQDYYDRISWEALLSASAGAVMVGVLTMQLTKTFSPGEEAAAAQPLPPAPTAEALADNVLATQHVAHLGGRLFSRHLIAIQVAGILLTVALIGAVAVVAHSRSRLAEGGIAGRG